MAVSTIEYVEKNCVAAHHGVPFKINFLPNPWISGQGTGNTNPVGTQGNGLDRAVYYKNDKKALYLKIPQPFPKAIRKYPPAYSKLDTLMYRAYRKFFLRRGV